MKDLMPAAQRLYEYTWEVVAYMILIGKEHLGPDIWPETPEQAKSTKNIMRSICGKKAHWQYKASGTKSCPLSPFGKEARFVGLPYCYGHLVAN